MNEEYKTVRVVVDDTKAKLITSATMLPKDLVETIINGVLEETKGSIPKSKVDAGLRKYIEYLEHNRNLWRVTALIISALFFITSTIRLFK